MHLRRTQPSRILKAATLLLEWPRSISPSSRRHSLIIVKADKRLYCAYPLKEKLHLFFQCIDNMINMIMFRYSDMNVRLHGNMRLLNEFGISPYILMKCLFFKQFLIYCIFFLKFIIAFLQLFYNLLSIPATCTTWFYFS